MAQISEVGLRQVDVEFQAGLYVDPNATRSGLHLGRRRWVEDALALYLPRPAKAMEVGIGCGIFTRYMAKLGAAVTAVDINAGFLLGIADVPGVIPVLADATRDLPVEPQDIILCTEVLEHVPHDRSLALLRSLHRSLKPEGRLILTTPQAYSVVEIMARLLKLPPMLSLARRIYGSADELGHINLLTRNKFRAQLATAGFETEISSRFGFYLPGVAEFGGLRGWKFLNIVGETFSRLPVLGALLWTQAYVLRKVDSTPVASFGVVTSR